MLAAATAELGGLPPGTSVPGLQRFSKRKRHHRPIAMALGRSPELDSYARAIGNCANTLELALGLPEGQEPTLQLTDCNPCNRRLCPFCEWRRSRVWRGRLVGGLGPFFEHRPTDSAVFLTLTQRNVPLGELGATIKEMHRSWNRLVKWRQFPTEYWFRRTEITIGQPSFTDDLPRAPRGRAKQAEVVATAPDQRPQGQGLDSHAPAGETAPGTGVWCHPHIHALLLVPASYWGRSYIRQGEWQKQWMMAARLDYAPVVDIRRAKAKASSGERFEDAKDAAIEAAKYTTKATDLIGLGESLPEFAHQMRHHRLVAMSQPLGRFVPEHDPTRQEMADERDPSLPAVHPTVSCIAQWCEQRSDYVLTPR